jgi:hypothetical protein
MTKKLLLFDIRREKNQASIRNRSEREKILMLDNLNLLALEEKIIFNRRKKKRKIAKKNFPFS